MFGNSFYFLQKLVFGNINKKQFSCIFEIKKHVWLIEIKKKIEEKNRKY